MAEKIHASQTSRAHEPSPQPDVVKPLASVCELEPQLGLDWSSEIALQPYLLPHLGGEARTQSFLNLQRTIGNRAVQRTIDHSRSTESGDDLAQQIRAASAGGSALDAPTRARLQTGLNADLSSVRVHTDGEADRLARSVSAVAFTTGQDIFFRSGAYDPTSSQGLHLLAHEATHTLQQSAGPVAGTSAPGGVSISDPSDSFEQTAEQAAKHVVSRATVPAPRLAGDARVQRQTSLEDEDEAPIQARSMDVSTSLVQRAVLEMRIARSPAAPQGQASLSDEAQLYWQLRHKGLAEPLNAETDRRFWLQHPQDIAPGTKLDPHNPKHTSLIKDWLKLRDMVVRDAGEHYADVLNVAFDILRRTAARDTTVPKIPAGVPTAAIDLLWELWTAGTGQTMMDGKPSPVTTAQRLQALKVARSRLQPYLTLYKAAQPNEAPSIIAEQLDLLSSLEQRCYADEAYEKANAAIQPEAVERMHPELAAESVKLHISIEATLWNVTAAIETVNRFKEEELTEAIKHLEEHNELVKGTTLLATLQHAKSVLSLVDAIITISDPQKIAELEEELKRSLDEGGLAGVAGVGSGITEILSLGIKLTGGTVSICATVAGVAAKAAGLGEEAAKCFAVAGEVGGKITFVLSAAEVVHGVFVLIDPNASAEKKAEAGRDIVLGGLGVAGTLGWISGAAAGGLSVGVLVGWYQLKWGLEQIGEVVEATSEYQVREDFKADERDGQRPRSATSHD